VRPGPSIPRSVQPVLKLSRLPSGRPEIFASIQGEGPTRGLPSVFVRLALCNLHCDWCDTRYTWDWDQFDRDAEIVEQDPIAVVDQVEALGHRTVVITGGEPLLQQHALAPFAATMKRLGRRIEIETNGTLQPLPELDAGVDQWNVSPKLASSGNALRLRTASTALRAFAAKPNAYFKFVVCEREDVEEIKGLVVEHDIPSHRVILMPEARDAATLADRGRWLIPLCYQMGVAFSPRLQITLWGGARAR
jgi:7-carboxy-7-deazaguanine synthase